MKCNVCGGSEFGNMGSRINVRCIACGSLERTRMLWLHLERIKIGRQTKILHLAPEAGIYKRLQTIVDPDSYIVADFDPSGYGFARNVKRIDLCDLASWRSCEFDLIIHSHVLEHTPCNIAYSLFHIHRMLKDNGYHVCIIPFMSGGWDECFSGISADERTERFGQVDHVRKFGRDDISLHVGAILNIPTNFDATESFSTSTLIAANIPENNWRGFHPGTVLTLAKSDMKLIQG